MNQYENLEINIENDIDNDNCFICLDNEDVLDFPCENCKLKIHKDCYIEYIKNFKKCSVCRKDIQRKNVFFGGNYPIDISLKEYLLIKSKILCKYSDKINLFFYYLLFTACSYVAGVFFLSFFGFCEDGCGLKTKKFKEILFYYVIIGNIFNLIFYGIIVKLRS